MVDQMAEAQSALAIASVQPDYEFYMDRAYHYIQFKNQANARCDVTVWAWYPKRDISAAFDVVTGVNPAWIQHAFNSTYEHLATVPSVTPRLKPFDEHNADLTQCPKITDFFKIRKVGRYYLMPGDFKKMVFKWRKGRVMTKNKDGVLAASSWDATYRHQKWMGPLIVFRCQGALAHDENAVTSNPNWANTDFTPVPGPYNVEFYGSRRWKSYANVGTAPIQVEAVTTSALSVPIDSADARAMELQAPFEAVPAS